MIVAAALAAAAVPAAAQDAPAAAAVSEPVRDSKLLSVRPMFVSGKQPEELPEAQAASAARRWGTARISAIVTTTGTLRDMQIVLSSGDPAIDAALVEMLKSWKLTGPRDRGGKPVEAVVTLPFAIGALGKRLSGEQPKFSDEAKALGHHGEVEVRAQVGESGAVENVSIYKSSKSPLLDAAAVEAVRGWRYDPSFDLRGKPQRWVVAQSFKFSQAEAGGGSYLTGLKTYGCAAFVSETDWWQSVHSGDDNEKPELDSFLLGALYLAPESFGLKKGNTDVLALTKWHKQAWSNALARCREKPGSTFLAEYRKG